MDNEKTTETPAGPTREERNFEVVVIGGGLAGLCAALAAAREGAKTALINDRPVLGGNASTEIRIPPSGASEHNPWALETGVILELLLEERVGAFARSGEGMVNAHWDTVLYDLTRREKNLSVFPNTSVVDVVMESERRIAAVVGLNRRTEKWIRFAAPYFIEATGDGLVGALAGVPFRYGPEARAEYGEPLAPETPADWTLGCSLYFHARDVGHPVEFHPPAWAAKYDTEESLGERHHAIIEGGYWWIEVGYPWHTIKHDDEIRDELLRHLYGVWDHVKNHCRNRDKARTYALDWVGMLPGRRESRRFVGAYVLNENDLRARTLFPDRIAYGGWIIDDHTKGGILEIRKKPSFDDVTQGRCLVPPYSVPLRSLYCTKVENLFFAGRVMSASRVAFNSLRVMRTLAVIGQAAGTAAAHSARTGRAPLQFTSADIHQVQQSLLRQDCYIPFVRNEDGADLAPKGHVTASSEAGLSRGPDGPGLELTSPVAQIAPLSEDHLDRVALYLENRSLHTQKVCISLHPARDIWDLSGLRQAPTVATEVAVEPGAPQWVEARLNLRLEPRKIWWLRAEAACGVFWHVDKVPLPGFCVAGVVHETWELVRVRGAWRNLTFRTAPASRPFGPENVINGVSRPETWPNLWISDPSQRLPQWIELCWPKPQRFNLVQLAFDVGLQRSYWEMPAGFRAPECVKDYALLIPDGNAWRPIASVTGNYQRLNVVEFAPVTSERLRLLITATNGDPCARLYEIRVCRSETA